MSPDSIRIGTRGSDLALWQAHWVGRALEGLHPGLTVSVHTIKTTGDKILDAPLSKIRGTPSGPSQASPAGPGSRRAASGAGASCIISGPI